MKRNNFLDRVQETKALLKVTLNFLEEIRSKTAENIIKITSKDVETNRHERLMEMIDILNGVIESVNMGESQLQECIERDRDVLPNNRRGMEVIK